jgi:hypothetical protein
MASKEDLESAKRDMQVKELQRKSRIAAWNDYISFGTSKAGDLTAIVCGGLDVLNPSLIPHIPHPEMLLGGGLALLGGKSILNVISKVLKGSGAGG